jgi:hypothetical protein
MIVAAFLLAALPQQHDPGQQSEQARQWWSQLSVEQQQEYKRRHQAMEEAIANERSAMSEADLEKFGKMSEREQRVFLHSRAKVKLKAKPGNDEGRPPRRQHRGLAEREPEIRAALLEAHAQGWLGERTMSWLGTASVHEAMQVLLGIRKWQFLEKAQNEGFWQKNNIDEKLKLKLIAMPAEHFFKEIKHIIRGEHKMLRSERQDKRNRPPRGFSEQR